MRARAILITALVASVAATATAAAAPDFTPREIRGVKVGNTLLWAHVFHAGKPSSGSTTCTDVNTSLEPPPPFTGPNASGFSFSPAPGFAADWGTVLSRSFATWNSAANRSGYFAMGSTAPLTMSRPSNLSDGINYMGLAPLSGRTLAVTYTWSQSGAAVETDMFFNSKVSWGDVPYFVDAMCPTGDRYDREAIATHELGHSFGFDHISGVTEATMYPSASAGETRKRTLTQGEITAARLP